MSKAALDKFGELIVQSLRDRTIAHYDGLANGHWKAPALIGLEQELQALDEYQRSIVRRCVISSIDVGIHDFLFHLPELGAYEGTIQISVDGQEILTLSSGRSGELFGADGWLAKYSKYGSAQDI